MHSIDSESAKKYIEPHLHFALKQSLYSVDVLEANTLLLYKRLDIAFKLFYLRLLDNHVPFAEEMYIEHIRAFSLGEFSEPGNTDKNSIEKYMESFYETFLNIKEHGFDIQKTLIPISSNKTIINGAHRVSSAIYLNKTVSCIELDCDSPCYDYKFFYQRNVPIAMIEQAVTTFIEYANNVHIAFLWPIGKSTDEQIESLIPNIVYKKEIILTANGAHNLLSQIYYGEEWLGTVENDFSGSKGKLIECFKNFDPIKIVAFQAESLDEVLKIKENVRQTFNVGKHSIHITDTKEEALRTAQIVFNENSIHFLNYAKPNRYISTHKKIEKFKNFLEKNNLSSEEVLIDSSMTLSVYGLREAKDIDFFCNSPEKISIMMDEINEHDEVLLHYSESKNEIIYNSKYYFYFNEIKFISFSQLFKMKTNRAEVKDKNDCKMMEALIENNQFKSILNQYKQKLFYGQILLRQKIIEILQKLGIFNVARKMYRKIKAYDE